jgi:hypothetical protein
LRVRRGSRRDTASHQPVVVDAGAFRDPFGNFNESARVASS